MKRRVWVLLAAVVLLAAFWCATAGADYIPAQFLEPVTLDVAISNYQVVTVTFHWRLNFAPTKVELYQTRPVSAPLYIRTLEGDLSQNGSATTSWNYEYYYYHIKDNQFFIRAYDTDDDVVSSQVFPMMTSRVMDFYVIEPNGYYTQYAQIAYNGSNWPNDPVRQGMLFEGWYNDDNYTEKNTGYYSRSVFARFVNPCTVVFYLNGHGTQAPPQQVLPLSTPGTHVQEPEPPTAAGYTFDGWYTMPSCERQYAYNFNSELTASTINLYAKWRPNVTFDANGGTVSVNEAVTDDNGKLSSLPVPTRDGYVFTGWYTAAYGGVKVDLNRVYTAAATIYAHWIVMPEFTTQPAGGTVYPWADYRISWTTDQVPKKIDIGYKNGSSWISKETITTDLKKSMSYDLTYNDAVAKDTWAVRAYYGEGNFFVTSQTFSIAKTSMLSCGTNAKAVISDGVLTITGSGAIKDYGNTASTLAPWYPFRDQIQSVVIGEGITKVGTRAFFNCSTATDITIPVSMTEVRDNAFAGCLKLKRVSYDGFKSQWDDISVGSNNGYFRNAAVNYLYRSGTLSGGATWRLSGNTGKLEICGGNIPGGPSLPWYNYAPYIREIWAEYGVQTIGADAFRDCSGVTEVHIDEDVTMVGERAFQDCDALTDVYYNSALTVWNQINIKSGNTPLTSAEIHTEPLSGCLKQQISWHLYDSGLLVLTYDGMDYEEPAIEDFDDAQEPPPWEQYTDLITSVCVESGIYRIGNYAFANLSSLQTIEIGDTVASIGKSAFWGCTSLQDFILPDSITEIGSCAFSRCYSLEHLTLPDNLEALYTGTFESCSNLEVVHLPSGLTGIGDACFRNCSLIDRIYIPSTVTYIGEHAFADCDTLRDVPSHVYFGGTSAQWAAIDMAGGNDDLINAGQIHMTPEELRISAGNFPDANFRAVVANAFDTDHSGWLSDAEIAAVNSFGTEDTDYTTVQGMEYFTNMTSILLDGAPSLSSIDLTANTKLRNVDIEYNGLTEVNIEGLYDLTDLDVSMNSLTTLDVSEFALDRLICYTNPMSSLTLGYQSNLRYLSCYGTDLDTLDLLGCPLLIDCVANGTRTVKANYVEYKIDNTHVLCVDAGTELIVPGLVPVDEAHFPDAAFRLWVSDNADRNGSGWLSQDEIDVTDMIYLNVPVFASLASVQGIEYFTEAEELIIENAPNLTSIDLSANTDLFSLEITATGLTALDVSELSLKYLYCNGNALTSLTLGRQSILRELYCYGNPGIKTLDLRSCSYLLDAVLNGTKTVPDWGDLYEGPLGGRLYADANTELTVPGCIPIDAEHFPDEEFRNLIRDNLDTNCSGWLTPAEIAAVKYISFEDHDFTTAQGIEYFTELEILCIADADSLTAIDLQANTRLTDVDLCYNGLREINLNGLTTVKNLYVYNNSLTELDLSGLAALVRLECENNSLTELDITGCPYLIEAYHGVLETSAAGYYRYTAGDYEIYVDKGVTILAGDPEPTFFLPANLTTIEDEAFSGISAEAVFIPNTVTGISGNPFAGSSVQYIYGYAGSAAETLARNDGFIFVTIDDAWTAGH